MNIGEKLYELRKEKNLSQEEVADKLNVTRQTISKWETNQSTPDFDKIVPICELFEISTEELLTGKKTEEEVTSIKEQAGQEEPKNEISKEEFKRKSAEVVSTSVFLYILSIVAIIVLSEINDILAVSVFFIIIAFATSRLIKNYMYAPKFEKTKKEKKEKEIIRNINGIISTICLVIYFIVSFATMAWYITWVIFIISGIITQIVRLIFLLNDKEESENEE